MSHAATDKAFAPAAERNAGPILEVLRPALEGHSNLLEIGSGTGQHAVHFASAMPWLRWQCSDVAGNLPDIDRWLAEARLPNTPDPICLDVAGEWPALYVDVVFSANTLHIMGWPEVVACIEGIGRVLEPGGLLVVYGPFRRDGVHTAVSNADFEQRLRAEDPARGIRDMADIDALAAAAGLTRIATHPMPANNFCLIWQR